MNRDPTSARPSPGPAVTELGDDMSRDGLCRVLGRLAVGLVGGELPDDVVAHVKRHLLYNLVCGLFSGDRPAAAWSLAKGTAPATATLLLIGDRVNVESAAFANACLLHARAQDDTHYPSQCHPGCVVIPAALAAAERSDADPHRLLCAIVAGYEVTAAIGEPLCDAAIARGIRPASVFGALGAATAAAVAGLGQTWTDGSEEWAYQVAGAARAGVTAALLSQAGVRSAARALEGEKGFAAMFAGSGLPEVTLGEQAGRWRTTEVVYKPYPACNIVQAPVHATVEIVRAHDLAAADLAFVRCGLNPDDWAYPGTQGRPPFGGSGGPLMSAAYCIAVAAAHRGLPLDVLSGPGEQLSELVSRIELVPDASLSPLDTWIEIDTIGGERFRVRRAGDTVSYAWPWDDIVSWARELATEQGPPLENAVEQLIDIVGYAPEAADAGALARATVVSR